ncbi:hypothetical protein CESP606_21605 [Cereibacter sphaeroides]
MLPTSSAASPMPGIAAIPCDRLRRKSVHLRATAAIMVRKPASTVFQTAFSAGPRAVALVFIPSQTPRATRPMISMAAPSPPTALTARVIWKASSPTATTAIPSPVRIRAARVATSPATNAQAARVATIRAGVIETASAAAAVAV